MSKQLNLDEMLEILMRSDHPHAPGLQASLEAIGTHMADQIAELFGNLGHDAPKFEGTAFAGTCAPFWRIDETQPWPELLGQYDSQCDE